MPHQRADQMWLVDASIYVFKYWYALPDTLVDKDGNPANAVFGFLDFVLQLLKKQNRSQLIFAFDESFGTSYRNEIYPEYKANRPPAPDELKYQFLLCRQFLRAAGITEYSSFRYEADDIVGSFAAIEQKAERAVTIVSGDKDLTQLINEPDLWWEYANNHCLDTEGVKKQFGVWPSQIADLLALAGDKVDNIPGVPGVGKVTAARLLARFKTIDQLLEFSADIASMNLRGAARIRDLIESHRDDILLARRLTRIVTDLEQHSLITVEQHGYCPSLEELYRQLKFRPGLCRQWDTVLADC